MEYPEQLRLREHKQEALERAIDSLSRYKFMLFGYWSGVWVHLNQIDTNKEPNPFKRLVAVARTIQQELNGQESLFPDDTDARKR